MMLPSGNDASSVIAEHLGNVIINEKNEKQNTQIDNNWNKRKEYFVNEMNKKARSLNCKNTYYTNPHGMDENNNHSTAYDQMIISDYSLKYELVREVVKC